MSSPLPSYRNLQKSEDLFEGPEPACPLIQSGATEFCSELPTILPVVYGELIRESPGESVLPLPPQITSANCALYRQGRLEKGSLRERSYDSLAIQEESRKARAELTKLNNLSGKSYPRLARLLDKINRSAQEEIELVKRQEKLQLLKRTRQLSMPGRLQPSENQTSQQRYFYPVSKESITPNVISCSYPEQIKGFNEYSQQLLKIKPQIPVATPVRKPVLATPVPQRLRAFHMPTQASVIKKPGAREMSCPPRQTPHLVRNEYELQNYYQDTLTIPKPVMSSELKDLTKFEKLKEDVERINRPRSNRTNQQIQAPPYRSLSHDVYYPYQPGYVVNNQVTSYQPYYGYSPMIPKDTQMHFDHVFVNPTVPTQIRPVGSYQGYIPGYDQTNYAKEAHTEPVVHTESDILIYCVSTALEPQIEHGDHIDRYV
ncbi:hypothetical protein ACTXT7_001106 [Hymenolepis weldensis]